MLLVVVAPRSLDAPASKLVDVSATLDGAILVFLADPLFASLINPVFILLDVAPYRLLDVLAAADMDSWVPELPDAP